ncbi:MAG: hypothetical protein HDQ98_00290 [Lachnospiraceae bacterium]|nr:hypothetical protein [Lachnospiraceae bacterium]
MRKTIYVFILIACVCVSVLLTRQYDRKRFGKTDIEREEINMESDAVGLLCGDSTIDLGKHVVAYRISADEEILSRLGGLEKFSGSDYIAICPIPFNEIGRTDTCIQYLPDVYGNIMEMRVEDSGELYIRYADAGSDQEKEVWIPIYLPSQEENSMDLTKGFHTGLSRKITSGQEGLKAGEEGFRRTVWTECFQAGGQSYEVVFDRVSPIYGLMSEVYPYFADYDLSVKDETGSVISQQRFINFPVQYEEVHYMVDFSGDGFMDIALCTYMFLGKNSSSDVTTLIWNPETKTYERKDPPLNMDNWCVGRSVCAFQTWNEELSVLSGEVGEDEYDHIVLERYSFVNGCWRRVGKVEPLYDENELGEMGEPICIGYHELLYSENGELIEENEVEEGIWLDEESVWSWYSENIKLYPAGMTVMETEIGGIVVYKYVAED